MAKKTNRREFVKVAGLVASGSMATAGALRGAVPESQGQPVPRTMGARFRALMDGPEPLICPNGYDTLTARLIEAHGFKGVFIGSSVANQALAGLPDQAIVTVSEIIEYDSTVASNVDIPVLADLDDFGATPLTIYRLAQKAERGGIGCAAFDDRMPLNRATAYAVPGVHPRARMIDNIHAAADARTDMVLIVRCLAPTPNNSYTEMLDRAGAYAEAGADAVWLGLPRAEDYVNAAGMITKPLMATVGSQNLPATAAALQAARITVGQVPSMVNIALGAVDRALVELKATGRRTEAIQGALGREMSDQIRQVEELDALSRKYNIPSASAPER
jgi:2-methylisocitrate lyase-like PEP mutase family enzyme